MRRFTRLTNAFSRKAENHAHMVVLYTTGYNFARQHKTLRCSPATAAGLSTTLWSMADVAALVDAAAEPAKARGTYKPRACESAVCFGADEHDNMLESPVTPGSHARAALHAMGRLGAGERGLVELHELQLPAADWHKSNTRPA